MFHTILIANRGEIACRVMRTAKRMGIATVAVYSDADAGALHVEMADEAFHIGPSPATESYLRADAIIKAAMESGADAIHPGYGFLSENPSFVEAVEKAGLIFVGPSADAIRTMGLKDAAKKRMEEAGVPVVPGYHGEGQDAVFLEAQAKRIGYPVLIKARAGGGGKGMRLVHKPQDFADALEGAKREGEASFGDGHVLIEKFIKSPRHIEVQVFGDSHGNVVHLFERDCSLQRRHQKVIEEAPAPHMPIKVRDAMTDAAVRAAKAIGYENAGTIEFIADGSGELRPDGFWFMEMNTRLQVEHPVTEAITGVDLVEWQLRVAGGEPLPKTQEQITIHGHAFEARLYAEDVPKGFLPATGRLAHLSFSDTARNETGVRSGDTITPHYDPMIAKIITHGDDRKDALYALSKALAHTRIAGTLTNQAFLLALSRHQGFAEGEVNTGLIEKDLADLIRAPQPSARQVALAALAAGGFCENSTHSAGPFSALTGFSLWEPSPQTVRLIHGEEEFVVSIVFTNGLWQILVDGQKQQVFIKDTEVQNQTHTHGGNVSVFCKTFTHEFTMVDAHSAQQGVAISSHALIAPMPGLIKKLAASTKDDVHEGDTLIVLEAMKMEHTLRAPRHGVIAAVFCVEGEQVEDGTILLEFEKPDG